LDESSRSERSRRKAHIHVVLFKYCDWMKVLAVSLPVGFWDEWKRALSDVAEEKSGVESI
jgi:hypothetical protein